MFGPENIWLVAIGGAAALVANILYMIGGSDMDGDGPMTGQKWLRRFIASSILALVANLIAMFMQVWHWQYLLFWPILSIGFSLGYGADTVAERVLKRTLCALAIVSCCAAGAWVHQFTAMSLIVGGLSVFSGIASVVLGVLNPFNNAPLEQFLVCQVLTLYVPFWAFVK